MCMNYPHQKDNTKDVSPYPRGHYYVNVAQTIPQIYVALEDYQVDHQSIVVEVEGKIAK
jgi:hypothetical protein